MTRSGARRAPSSRPTDLTDLEKFTVKQLADPGFAASFLRSTKRVGLDGYRAGYRAAIHELLAEVQRLDHEGAVVAKDIYDLIQAKLTEVGHVD